MIMIMMMMMDVLVCGRLDDAGMEVYTSTCFGLNTKRVQEC
jgi:hypothetical protein